MQAKTMEGLAGASMNMKMVNVPIRVYKEAERRGDLATMERAMGYASEFTTRAVGYKEKAEEGTKEDAELAKEKEKLEREKGIEKRREEREEFEERLEEQQNTKIDTVEVSEEGKELLEANAESAASGIDHVETDIKTEPVTYTKTGEVSKQVEKISMSISV